jgi:hypothetical protein
MTHIECITQLRVMPKTLQNTTDQGIQNNSFSSCVTSFETQSPILHGESKLLEQCCWNCERRKLTFSYEIPSSCSVSSSMTLQSNADLRLLYGLLPDNSLINLCFQFVILHLLIPRAFFFTQENHHFIVQIGKK